MPGSLIVVSPTEIASDATMKNQAPDIESMVFQTRPGVAKGTSRRQKRCQPDMWKEEVTSSRSRGTERSDW